MATAPTRDIRYERAKLTTETPPAGPSRRYGIGFWLAGYVFAITMAFSAVPAPLYVLYQARDHFGAMLVTIIFSVYALGVAVSLFLIGHVSDWLGRRRILLIAVGVNMMAGLLFIGWPTIPGLIIGRVISGVSIGMLSATSTAYLSELHAAARPRAPRTRPEMVAAAASLGGLGLGSLVAGLLAQYAGAPLLLPYLVFEAFMLAGCVALAVIPETVRPPEQRRRYHPQRIAVPAASRAAFYAASVATAVAFALFGLFTSLAPGFIAVDGSWRRGVPAKLGRRGGCGWSRAGVAGDRCAARAPGRRRDRFQGARWQPGCPAGVAGFRV